MNYSVSKRYRVFDYYRERYGNHSCRPQSYDIVHRCYYILSCFHNPLPPQKKKPGKKTRSRTRRRRRLVSPIKKKKKTSFFPLYGSQKNNRVLPRRNGKKSWVYISRADIVFTAWLCCTEKYVFVLQRVPQQVVTPTDQISYFIDRSLIRTPCCFRSRYPNRINWLLTVDWIVAVFST